MTNSSSQTYPRTQTATIDTSDVAQRISAALRRQFGDLRHATKVVAAQIGADPRALKNWLYGRNAPQLADALKLAIECDEVAAEIMKIIAEGKAKRCSHST